MTMSEVEQSDGIKHKRRRSRKDAAIPTVSVPDESESWARHAGAEPGSGGCSCSSWQTVREATVVK